MSEHKRGSRAGKRGSFFRPSKSEGPTDRTLKLDEGKWLRPPPSATAVIGQSAALVYECSDLDEREYEVCAETGIKPRQSTTKAQHLGIFPQTMEFEPRDVIRRDPATLQIVEVIRKNRVTYKSTKSLLVRGLPDDSADNTKLKRLTSRSKRIQWDRTVERPGSDILKEVEQDNTIPPLK